MQYEVESEYFAVLCEVDTALTRTVSSRRERSRTLRDNYWRFRNSCTLNAIHMRARPRKKYTQRGCS